jgi:ZIP family zinc transporter
MYHAAFIARFFAQDIPEGMTASFVLRNLGMSKRKAFFYGHLTGLVQPVAGTMCAGCTLYPRLRVGHRECMRVHVCACMCVCVRVRVCAGVIGAVAVVFVSALLPYAVAFAGSAMLFVIVKDMLPDIMTGHMDRMQTTIIVMTSYAAMVIMSSLIDSISNQPV